MPEQQQTKMCCKREKKILWYYGYVCSLDDLFTALWCHKLLKTFQSNFTWTAGD